MSVVSATTSKWSEFKFKIYTFIEYGFTQSDSNLLLDNVRQVNCLLKVFCVKKRFFTLIDATCHYPMDNIHEAISVKFLRIKHCLFIIVFNERETRCVNFVLDLHVLLRLQMRPCLVNPNETFRRWWQEYKGKFDIQQTLWSDDPFIHKRYE